MTLESTPQIDHLLTTAEGRAALQNLVNLEKLGNTIDRVFGVDAAGARENQKDYKVRTERAASNERDSAVLHGIGATFAGVTTAFAGIGVINTTTNTTGDESFGTVAAIIGESAGIVAATFGGVALGVSAVLSSRTAKLAQQYASLSDETRASIVEAGMGGSVYEPNGLESYLQMVHEHNDAVVVGLRSEARSAEVGTPGL